MPTSVRRLSGLHPLHAGHAAGLRSGHLDLVGAYRTQLDVVKTILRGGPTARHEAMVHVAGRLPDPPTSPSVKPSPPLRGNDYGLVAHVGVVGD